MSYKRTPKKVLMHIECLRGTGEFTMAARVAKAMADRGMEVVVVSGNVRKYFDENYVNEKTGGSIRIEKLPTISYTEHENQYLTDDNRRLDKAPDWVEKRADRLIALAEKENPDAVVICYWPFANGQGVLDYEMEKFSRWLDSRPQTAVALSIRDVIHADSTPYRGDKRKAVEFINNSRVNTVLVHGDKHVIPLTEEGIDYPSLIRKKMEYTGYVCTKNEDAERQAKDTIVIAPGGGFYRPSNDPVWEKSLKALEQLADDPHFMEALASKDIRNIHVIVSSNCPPETRKRVDASAMQLQERLREKKTGIGIKVESALPYHQYMDLLSRCGLYIGQAGMATVLDVLTFGFPAVMVPIEEKDKEGRYHFDEQRTRADLLAKHHLFAMIPQADLHGADGVTLMAGQIKAILHSKANDKALRHIRCNGAENSAKAIESLINAQQRRHAASR